MFDLFHFINRKYDDIIAILLLVCLFVYNTSIIINVNMFEREIVLKTNFYYKDFIWSTAHDIAINHGKQESILYLIIFDFILLFGILFFLRSAIKKIKDKKKEE